MVFFAVFVTKMADLGAYITGLLFGRHLLIPRISPRKTIQGLIGGLIFALVAGLSIKPMLPFSLLQTGVFSLILAGFGQIGDLSESLIKRDCQVKDSANIIQGVGGVMDLIDSLLFSVPVMYVILRWL
jgi:phosphatidate cytidylyltransferase